MALILNLESATEVCSVSLYKDGKQVAIRENHDGRNHANFLTVFVEEILQETNLRMADLDAIAVTGGPGSYTGLRIGVSSAKGLCYGAKLPLIAINSLQSMAHHVANNLEQYNLPPNEALLFCPMIDARRMEVFTALYDNYNGEVRATSAEIVEENTFDEQFARGKVVFFGNGAGKCKEVLTNENAIFVDEVKSSSQYMAQLAEDAFQKEDFVDVAYYEPFYLKDFVATVPKKNIFG